LGELSVHDVAVRGATRDPRRAMDIVGTAAHWVEFDLERPESSAGALDGIDRVFMISLPGDDDADKFAGPFIEAMRSAGVQHVVHLSAMGTPERPDFSLRKVELLIETSGIPFTHLRPNFFMQVHSTGSLCQAIRDARRIALPAADARLSFIDARDVAAVAARVLLDAPSHQNRSYTLTGPEAIDYHEVAAAITRAIGHDVQYLPIDDDTTRNVLRSAGFTDRHIERLLAMYRLVRMGACEPVSADAAQLLSRPANRFEQFAADHARCWQ
jgi:uncharacterized protein YbjT (DUF2867 family)